jgi:hypothetical protein
MKVRMGLLGGAAAAGLLAAALTMAQEKKAAEEHPPDNPGAVHKQMAKWAGDYTTSSKFYAKPGQPTGEETTGAAKISSYLDGRFLQEENSGKMLGQDFTGMHLYGYNNLSGKYEATWIYTGATGMMTMTGTSKDEGKTIEYTANYEQKTGTKVNLAVIVRHIDDDKFVVELTAKNADGSKGPTLETTYTRKK